VPPRAHSRSYNNNQNELRAQSWITKRRVFRLRLVPFLWIAIALVSLVAPGRGTANAESVGTALAPASTTDFLRVYLRRTPEQWGLADPYIAKLSALFVTNAALKQTALLVPDREDIAIGANSVGEIVILGNDGLIRKRLQSESELSGALKLYLQQRSLLNEARAAPHTGQYSERLHLEIVAERNLSLGCRPAWLTEEWSRDGDRVLAECTNWQVKVWLDRRAGRPVDVGGAVLIADGTSSILASNGKAHRLWPGQSYVFQSRLKAGRPLDVENTVLLFFAPSALNEHPAELRSIAELVQFGMGKSASEEPFLVNDELDPFDVAHSRPPQWPLREYTLRHFDIRPYLPSAPNSPLRSVLLKADWLVERALQGTVKYSQHPWNPHLSDTDNLRRGIDCSGAVWFAFTRAGVPFDEGAKKLPTDKMIGPSSAMSRFFQRCELTQPRTGDLLVYRDAHEGHVVMVISPTRRIAWGSHDWDGSAELLHQPPARGVEYQLKPNRDWNTWDRADMRLVACWRNRAF
jgi:hypothetical protein